MIKTYLSEKTGFDGNITNGDRVCTACYKSHLQILKEVPSSTDRDLNELIDGLKGCTLGQHNIRSTEDVINIAMHLTTIYVGELLLQQESLLLPSVYGKFHTFLEDISHKYKIELQNDDTNKVTKCWILSNLVVSLQHHLSYACRVRKLGTLLYRTNGDLLTALTLALHRGTIEHAHNSREYTKSKEDPCDTIEAYCDKVNSSIHNEIRKHLSTDLKDIFLYMIV